MYVILQFFLGLMDGSDQHTDLGGISFQREFGREIPQRDLTHLIPDCDDRMKDIPACDEHYDNLHDRYQSHCKIYQDTDDHQPEVQCLDLFHSTCI